MKKVLFFLAGLFLMVPVAASAHTGLESSNPAKGQVITSELKKISLVFESKVENLSTMKVMKGEVEVPVSVKVNDSNMTGVLSKPLESGSYKIMWKIVGEDGHPISGEIPFTVNVKKDTEKKLTVKKTTEKTAEQEKKAVSDNSKPEEKSSSSTVFMIVLGLILIAGILLLFKKKK
ncbi:copper resistance protein CopC [Actinomycetes bacterium NPDC127524]